jgi:hypothetical protein
MTMRSDEYLDGLVQRLDVFFATILVFIVVAAIVPMPSCSGARPVDTSQEILVETGLALSHVDRAVAGGAESVRDRHIDRAVERVERGDCEEHEPPGECVVRLLREEMVVWYRLTESLEAAHGLLETWEEMNDGWRGDGERPGDWNDRICSPLRTLSSTILELLEQVGIDVPELWRGVVGRVDLVCSVGVAVATAGRGE